ncbi:MAG: CDGSH iron-sulfur domain-containing protein [bacterium]|nr:CDGSH iron-sulfur domain-containing protein [bacterium]
MPKEKFGSEKVIKIKKDGPYVVCGNIPMAKQTIITDEDGVSVRWEKGEEYPRMEQYSLCRCGNSENKPFCDSMHIHTGFRDDE